MSRVLPPQPNLEHLKKQAKQLLRELQERNPVAKLADAQHTLAREYGFASWPKLKVYVEAHSYLPSPFAGSWTANLAKSKRHPANAFQAAKLYFTVDGDSVTIVDVYIDESGHEQRGKNVILADGNVHPSEYGNGYALTARWRGRNILETQATKDGQPAGWGSYEVSPDGQTLTISGDDQMIVLEREA